MRADQRFLARRARHAAPPATSAPGCASTTSRTCGARARERRLGRVREHRPQLLALLRRRRAARDGAAAARRAAARCAVGRRAIAGYWTHGGYMNWDSGLGFSAGTRQEARPRPAGADRDRRRRRGSSRGASGAAWAKWMLDRGLSFYERLPSATAGLPDPVLFRRLHGAADGRERAAGGRARAANAARAVDAGLGRMARRAARRRCTPSTPTPAAWRSRRPPTTRRSSPVNQRAFPYGGIELARLFDGEQEVAAGIGGRAPAAFGMRCATPCGRQVLASQVGRSRVARRHAAAADQGAVGAGRERAPRPATRSPGRSTTCARPARLDRGTLAARHAPLHAAVHRDELVAAAGPRAARG